MFYYDKNGEECESNAIQPCKDWLLPKDAAAILYISLGTFSGEYRPGNGYFGIRRRLRGIAGKTSARGQGALWSRVDCERITAIRKKLGISIKCASRVFYHETQGNCRVFLSVKASPRGLSDD